MEIDQDYLRTGTAIGSRASHEHYPRFLLQGSDSDLDCHNSDLNPLPVTGLVLIIFCK